MSTVLLVLVLALPVARKRGRRFAIGSAGVALGVLVLGLLASKDRLREEWYLHRLRAGTAAEKDHAIEKLGDLRCLRAVPLLLESIGLDSAPPEGPQVLTLLDVEDLVQPEPPASPGRRPRFQRPNMTQARTLLDLLEECLGAKMASGGELRAAGPTQLAVQAPESVVRSVTSVLDTMRKVRRSLERMGEPAVAELEKLARDDSRSPLVRRFAEFELACRKSSTPHIVLPKGGKGFTVVQRETVAAPGSDETVYVSVGDITGGQTQLRVDLLDGSSLVERSVTTGDVVGFDLQGKRFHLRVKQLRNRFISDDYAVLILEEED